MKANAICLQNRTASSILKEVTSYEIRYRCILDKYGYRFPANLELEEAIKVELSALDTKTGKQDFWVVSYQTPAQWQFSNR